MTALQYKREDIRFLRVRRRKCKARVRVGGEGEARLGKLIAVATRRLASLFLDSNTLVLHKALTCAYSE